MCSISENPESPTNALSETTEFEKPPIKFLQDVLKLSKLSYNVPKQKFLQNEANCDFEKIQEFFIDAFANMRMMEALSTGITFQNFVKHHIWPKFNQNLSQTEIQSLQNFILLKKQQGHFLS